MKRISALVGVLAVLALMLPTTAVAASSTCQGYNQANCAPITITTGNGSGSLPFTGLDVVLLVAGGGVLLGAGFVVRRLSRQIN